MVSLMLVKITFTVFSITIAMADIKTGAVPRIAFCFAFPFFIMLIALSQQERLPESIMGLLIGLSVFLLVYNISAGRLGLADVWYSALVGLVMGIWRWYASIGIACVIGILYILTVKQRKIPFIPFMALGSVVMNVIQR